MAQAHWQLSRLNSRRGAISVGVGVGACLGVGWVTSPTAGTMFGLITGCVTFVSLQIIFLVEMIIGAYQEYNDKRDARRIDWWSPLMGATVGLGLGAVAAAFLG